MGEVCTVFWWGNLMERPLGIPRLRAEGNIKMEFQEVGCGGMDWIDTAQGMCRWRALVMR
jgi:hypothetical protein